MIEKPSSIELPLEALDLAPFLVGYLDRDFRYRFANRRYLEVFGLDPERIVGKQVHEVVGEQAFALLRPYAEKALAGQEVSYELWLTIADGTRRFFSTRYSPHEVDGEVQGFFAYGLDETEKRRAQEALAWSEQRFRAIFDSAAVGIALAGTDGVLAAANQYVFEVLGYEEAEVVGHPNSKFVHPEDEALIDSAARALLQRGDGFREVEVRYLRTDGGVVWAHISFSLLREEGENPDHFLAVIRDVTSRKAVEDALAASERMHRSLFENAAVGIARVGLDGSWLDVNDTLCRVLGYRRDELLKTSFQQLTHPQDLPIDLEQAQRLFKGEIDEYDLDKRFIRGDGAILWGHITASIVRDDDGEPLYAVGILEDITARKSAEDALRELNAQLEERVEERTAELRKVNQELDAFNYSVSHDLRAPIRGVDGFSQALMEDYEDQLDDMGKHFLRRIRSGAKRMSEMIDALLMLSRLSRGEVELRPVDLSNLAREAARGLEQESPDRDVQLKVEDGLRLQGDERLLRVLIQNLLENAWKFTREEAQALVQVGSEAHGRERVFFVRDNGAGFDPDYGEKLFVPFQRLHPGDQYEGQGIGLATVQRVVHRHGGRIWGEGKPSEGATFYFTLPTGES